MPKKPTPKVKKPLFSPIHKFLGLSLLLISLIGLGINLSQKNNSAVLGDRIAMISRDDDQIIRPTKASIKNITTVKKPAKAAPVKKSDTCGTGATCKKTMSSVCIKNGGEIDNCKSATGAAGNCCLPNETTNKTIKTTVATKQKIQQALLNCSKYNDQTNGKPSCKQSCNSNMSWFGTTRIEETGESCLRNASTNEIGVCCYPPRPIIFGYVIKN